METVYITGHRNPDMDSICSSYAYAVLKNLTDKTKTYKAVRCGHMSDTVKKQWSLTGADAPVYMRDVKAKVSDVMNKADLKIQYSSPIFDLVKVYSDSRPSALPVFDGETFKGLLSIDDIASWFLTENNSNKMIYPFTLKNISAVLPGCFVKEGESSFSASLLAGAAEFEDFIKFLDSSSSQIVVMGCRKKHIEQCISVNVKAIVITAATSDEASSILSDLDFSSFTGSIYVTELGTAEALRRLRMAPSVSNLMREQAPTLQTTDLYDDGKEALMNSHFRGISVFNGEEFAGFVTRRCFLSKPKYNVILCDHNETDQSIRGVNEASVCEIIDHHRLDALKTDMPIFIDAQPLGSTCTIVYQLFNRWGISPDPLTAKVLLCGIICDTLILKSPTTTDTDRAAAGALAALCQEYDIMSFGLKMFSQTETLATRDPKVVIESDFKVYKQKDLKIGIGQCETSSFSDIDTYIDKYITALQTHQSANGLDWSMLMVTDVLREHSLLLSTGHKLLSKLPFAPFEGRPNVLDMPKVLSRKKQLLPEVLHSME